MNIRSSILFAVALLILPLTAAQAHEFTLPDGRTVTGSVTAVGNGQVTIRTSDSRELHLPIANLAPADLDHARQWWNENRKYWFIINAEAKMQSGAAAKASEGMLKVTKRDWAYTVTVRNNTAYATPELQAEYAVFMSKPGQNVATPAITKPLRIPALNPGASYQFQTDAVDISTYRPPDGYYFTNGHGQRHLADVMLLGKALRGDEAHLEVLGHAAHRRPARRHPHRRRVADHVDRQGRHRAPPP